MSTNDKSKKQLITIPAWLRYAIYLLIAAFLLKSIWDSWEQVNQFVWRFSLERVVLALLMHSVYFICHGFLWVWIVQNLNVSLSFRTGFPIYAVSKLSKYIPGGIWPFASVATLARQKGLSATLMTASFLLTTVLAIWVSALYSIPLLPSILGNSNIYLSAIVGILLILAVILSPWILRTSVTRAAKLIGLSPNTEAIQKLTNKRTLGLLLVAFTLLHALDLASFFLFITSLVEISPIQGVYAALAWSAAWLIGFLVLFVPSGLGVREASLTLLLQDFLPASVGTAIGVGHRLFLTVFDLIVLILYLLNAYYYSKRTLRKTSIKQKE